MPTYTKKKSKVLLINPPSEFRHPILPLGLASIAGYLKTKNIDVSVIDGWAENFNAKELENRIHQSNADIIGVYMVSPRYDKGKETIEICHKALPKSIIIAGGPHPSAVPDEALNEIPQLDICGIGEGEITMYELVETIENNADLSGINGIAFRDKTSNEIIITKPREFIKDLDIMPLPARELFPVKKYSNPPPPYGRKRPYFTLITSRGCPYRCAYCSKDVFKDIFRARSPKSVGDELEELATRYGAKEVQFCDDDFSMDMKRAEEICDEILKRNLKLRWSCLTRANLVNDNLLRKMKQAGCWLIAYGVESGNQQILDGIGKNVTTQQIYDAFKMTREAGIAPLCSFMFGLPGETKETIQETIDFVKKLKPAFISCGVLFVYPGSRLFKLIQEGKYTGRLRVADKTKNLPGGFFKGNYTIFEGNFTLEQLQEPVQKIQREFYLQPQYLFQCLKSIRSFSDIHYYLNGGWALIKSVLR